jgi:hypothetical protein
VDDLSFEASLESRILHPSALLNLLLANISITVV